MLFRGDLGGYALQNRVLFHGVNEVRGDPEGCDPEGCDSWSGISYG